ncbi:MAG: PEP-CTERM sorting domain-containing protein [Desulfohalobiaceae bacterium]|nr:PEP-CTERM sorting domain-containing protein [Desulfohalobiaceae bacterium]
MKKLFVGLIVLVVTVFGTQAWATTLSFDPFVSSIMVGDSVDVDVMVAVAPDKDVGGFDFNVLFDDTILDFDSYSLSDNLGYIGDITDPSAEALDWSVGDLGGGAVHLSEVSWLGDLSFQPDSFSLATLSFTGIDVGASLLAFDLTSPLIIGDAWGNEICAVPLSGKIKVNPVPEPTTMLLFGTGMVGFGAILRKKWKI